MLIIAGTATYSGIETIKEASKQMFISELEIIQSKVNTIHEKINSNESDAEYYNNIGLPLDTIDQDKINTALGSVSQEGFKYFESTQLQSIGLEDINQQVLINFNTCEVVSVNGFEIDGVVYYKLKDIPGYDGYNVEYKNKNTRSSNIYSRKKRRR